MYSVCSFLLRDISIMNENYNQFGWQACSVCTASLPFSWVQVENESENESKRQYNWNNDGYSNKRLLYCIVYTCAWSNIFVSNFHFFACSFVHLFVLSLQYVEIFEGIRGTPCLISFIHFTCIFILFISWFPCFSVAAYLLPYTFCHSKFPLHQKFRLQFLPKLTQKNHLKAEKTNTQPIPFVRLVHFFCCCYSSIGIEWVRLQQPKPHFVGCFNLSLTFSNWCLLMPKHRAALVRSFWSEFRRLYLWLSK